MPRRAEPLTAKAVEAAKTDRAQQDFADGLVPGLTLRVSGITGEKRWYLSYRAGTKNRRMLLGPLSLLSLSDARKRAKEELVKVLRGEDPAQDKKDRRTGKNSFREMVEEIREKELKVRHEDGNLRDTTFKEWTRILDNVLLPAWGDRSVAEISRRDVLRLAEEIRGRGSPAMAKRVVSFVRFLFNRGLDREFPTLAANPAHKMKLPWKDGNRDRFLTAKEIEAVWTATAEEIPGVGNVFRIALLTGQRMGSVASMRWEDIEENGSGPIWRIPAEHFKGKRPHLVPLPPEVMEIIEAIRKEPPSKEWIFPSRPGTDTPFLVAWNKALDRIRTMAAIPSWTAHDFRTTFRTHATRSTEDGGLGVLPPIADQVLGHAENSLGMRHYTGDVTRYLLSEKREALLRWGAFVREIVEGKGKTK